MKPKFEAAGRRIDAALGEMDYDACREALGLGTLPEGELLARLNAAGTDIERLLISAIGTTVLQNRLIKELERANDSQRAALDQASDGLKRIKARIAQVFDLAQGEQETARDPVADLKAMLAGMDRS